MVFGDIITTSINMDRTERFFKINQLLQSRKSAPISLLTEALGVSRATIKRDLCYMRDRLYAPIVWDRNLRGYRFEVTDSDLPQYALPGIWFNSSEILGLLTLEYTLRQIQPGLLDSHIQPIRDKICGLLEHGSQHSFEALERRIRVIHGPAPYTDCRVFQIVAAAVLRRLRMQVKYLNRETHETTPRILSPQRLIHYNAVWYVDCWCHVRAGLRTFRLDNLSDVELTEEKAKDVDDGAMDPELASGFGIFAGELIKLAVLRFSSRLAPWIAEEQWHLKQQVEYDVEGRLVMRLPYSSDQELIMRILRYGPELEVLGPVKLRNKIKTMLKATSEIYAQ